MNSATNRLRHPRVRFRATSLIAATVAGLAAASGVAVAASPSPAIDNAAGAVDLTLILSAEYPCFWPVGMTPFLLAPSQTIGPGAYARHTVFIDEHTGTQWDAPAHFIPPPDSGLPSAGPMGAMTGEKVPAWRFAGEACVIDVSRHVDDAPPGHSFLITPEIVQSWEREHRPLGPGDVVLFRSGYSDRYYRPFPEGDRFITSALREESPGWPAPTPQTMKYLGERNVTAVGLDSASLGPLPNLAAAAHLAGAEYGLIWTECVTNLGVLPPTGSLYVLLAAKHAGGSGGEARALAITQPALAAELIRRARDKRVVDLSVLLVEDYPVTWPGDKPGAGGTRYLVKTLNAFAAIRGPFFARGHVLDSQAGTHVVAPSFALPGADFDRERYTSEIRQSLAEYERQFGPLGHSDVTVEKLPLQQMMGSARVIDVRHLIGTTAQSDWPASPRIKLEHVQQYEQQTKPIAAGDIVIFRSDYSDQHFKPLPQGNRMMSDPLVGKAEGWPAPEPEVISYLAERGVRCIGTDCPTLGGVKSKQALFVNWLAASRGLCLVEYLTGLAQLSNNEAYFIFAPIKLQGGHGGYGRALALY